MSWMIWLSIAIVLCVIEIFSLTFYFLCFAVGAGAGAIVSSIFPNNIYIQVSVAIVVAIVASLYAPKIAKIIQKSSVGYEDTSVVGYLGTTITSVSSTQPGVVKLPNGEWSALSEDGEIEIGTQVLVTALDKNTVIVKKKDDKN